jgi:hypothetical protein
VKSLSGTKWLKQRFKFFENFILTLAKHIGEHGICSVVNGVPEPSLVGFVAHIRPLLIEFCLTTRF